MTVKRFCGLEDTTVIFKKRPENLHVFRMFHLVILDQRTQRFLHKFRIDGRLFYICKYFINPELIVVQKILRNRRLCQTVSRVCIFIGIMDVCNLLLCCPDSSVDIAVFPAYLPELLPEPADQISCRQYDKPSFFPRR